MTDEAAGLAGELREYARVAARLEDLARRSLTLHPDERPDLRMTPADRPEGTQLYPGFIEAAVREARRLANIPDVEISELRQHLGVINEWDYFEDRNATDEEVEALGGCARILRTVADRLHPRER